MKLRDIYGNLIHGVGPVINVQLPQTQIISFSERDPKSVELERNVNAKMNSILENKSDKKPAFNPPGKIKIISYEESVRELRELCNTLKNTDNIL